MVLESAYLCLLLGLFFQTSAKCVFFNENYVKKPKNFPLARTTRSQVGFFCNKTRFSRKKWGYVQQVAPPQTSALATRLIGRGEGKRQARCKICKVDFSVSSMGEAALTAHANSNLTVLDRHYTATFIFCASVLSLRKCLFWVLEKCLESLILACQTAVRTL